MGKFQRVCARSLPEKLLLLEAAFWLPVARLIIHFVPMKWYSSIFLGKHMVESPKSSNFVPDDFLKQVSWATNAMSGRMPWKNKCFAHAMAAKIILRLRGLPSTLYLGLKKDEKKELAAHAWLRCGDRFVTGGDGTGYSIVSKFS
ncbi:MAG: lasso peptide biosynthesis B2 protein [Candidatus Riflebacteria bacterium]|nr:lasso peptide biosynthesis B2 protein [Candidatus Riflebacteria bacterium]